MKLQIYFTLVKYSQLLKLFLTATIYIIFNPFNLFSLCYCDDVIETNINFNVNKDDYTPLIGLCLFLGSISLFFLLTNMSHTVTIPDIPLSSFNLSEDDLALIYSMPESMDIVRANKHFPRCGSAPSLLDYRVEYNSTDIPVIIRMWDIPNNQVLAKFANHNNWLNSAFEESQELLDKYYLDNPESKN